MAAEHKPLGELPPGIFDDDEPQQQGGAAAAAPVEAVERPADAPRPESTATEDGGGNRKIRVRAEAKAARKIAREAFDRAHKAIGAPPNATGSKATAKKGRIKPLSPDEVQRQMDEVEAAAEADENGAVEQEVLAPDRGDAAGVPAKPLKLLTPLQAMLLVQQRALAAYDTILTSEDYEWPDGVPNSAKAEIANRINAHAATQRLQYLRLVAEVAQAAAPYVHPRVISVDPIQAAGLRHQDGDGPQHREVERKPAVDRPPPETQVEWIARRQREMEQDERDRKEQDQQRRDAAQLRVVRSAGPTG